MKNQIEDIRISEKPLLTVTEAVAYTGIGRETLMRLGSAQKCNVILHVGRRILFKRRLLEEYLESHDYI